MLTAKHAGTRNSYGYHYEEKQEVTACRHQHIFYDLLFDAAATALKTMGANNHGMKLGMTGVLHTHTRTLDYHPHVHFIVAGGGIVTQDKAKHWKPLD